MISRARLLERYAKLKWIRIEEKKKHRGNKKIPVGRRFLALMTCDIIVSTRHIEQTKSTWQLLLLFMFFGCNWEKKHIISHSNDICQFTVNFICIHFHFDRTSSFAPLAADTLNLLRWQRRRASAHPPRDDEEEKKQRNLSANIYYLHVSNRDGKSFGCLNELWVTSSCIIRLGAPLHR